MFVKCVIVGDADLSGTINANDYTLIDNAFNTQGLSLSASAGPAEIVVTDTEQVVVPEPGSLGLLAAAMLVRVRRRRSRRA